MKYILYVASVILLSPVSLIYAQDSKLFPFVIEGDIGADTGVVTLNLYYDRDYYPEGIKGMKSKVAKGSFYFNDSIPYPQGVTLSYGEAYRSSLFVVEPGEQKVVVDVKTNGEVPKVSNSAMQEYESDYAEAFNPVRYKRKMHNVKRDRLEKLYPDQIPDSILFSLEKEIKKVYEESDSILLKYVATYPDSYIALWKLIELFSFVGYENVYESTLAQFSDSLRSTYAGQVLIKKLKTSGMAAIGKKFPLITVVDRHDNKRDGLPLLGNKYTLVDFWYSNCYPCIAQFPHLRKIHEEHKDQGFEIIGVSTDKLKYEKMWIKAIDKYQLTWSQYWDKNGGESSRLSINKFPTNYLLDSKGKIIEKDLRPIELDRFLEENLE